MRRERIGSVLLGALAVVFSRGSEADLGVPGERRRGHGGMEFKKAKYENPDERQ